MTSKKNRGKWYQYLRPKNNLKYKRTKSGEQIYIVMSVGTQIESHLSDIDVSTYRFTKPDTSLLTVLKNILEYMDKFVMSIKVYDYSKKKKHNYINSSYKY